MNICIVCYDFGKFKVMYLTNYSADRDEIFCTPKAEVALSLMSLSFKLIHGLGFYEDLNFLKNACNR